MKGHRYRSRPQQLIEAHQPAGLVRQYKRGIASPGWGTASPAPLLCSRSTSRSTAAVNEGCLSRTAAAKIASRSVSDASMSRHCSNTSLSEIELVAMIRVALRPRPPFAVLVTLAFGRWLHRAAFSAAINSSTAARRRKSGSTNRLRTIPSFPTMKVAGIGKVQASLP
jgi:hypothetical protein